MKNRKYTRKSLRYKVKMFWYRLTLEDVKRFIGEYICGLIAMIAWFAIMLILPHIFH